jgi:hypothetical protein
MEYPMHPAHINRTQGCLVSLLVTLLGCGCGGGGGVAGDDASATSAPLSTHTALDAGLSSESKKALAAGPGPCRPENMMPLMRAKFMPNVVVYPYDKYIVVESNGVPVHGSPYFPPGTPGHLPYNGGNPRFFNNGNPISLDYRYRFVIPACPYWPGYSTPTPMGPIGVSVEGVPFYNQYAGGGALLGNDELDSFDQFNGHADPMRKYHYHKEPWWITQRLGKSALIGYLLDGFPVYGPHDNGQPVQWWQLDGNHAHTHPTAEYPQGIYHYHTTDTAPYINGGGFTGKPGYATVTP